VTDQEDVNAGRRQRQNGALPGLRIAMTLPELSTKAGRRLRSNL